MAAMLSVKRQNWEATVRFATLVRRIESGKFTEQLFYGVVDAGRKTKTKVQRAVFKQMAVSPGKYSSYVVRNTRGTPRRALLAYDIYGVKGGIGIENYRGLRVLARRETKTYAGARKGFERGYVKSGVWNHPRVFKRSFAEDGAHLAILPGEGGRAPKALWTFGYKPNQPRGAGGRFAPSGVKYGKIRKLYGPALLKEIPTDQSLITFYKFAPAELQAQVGKRLAKLVTF